MGFIVDDNDQGIHGECRRESFVIYDDLGIHWNVELKWDQLVELEYVLGQIRRQGEKLGKIPPRPLEVSSEQPTERQARPADE